MKNAFTGEVTQKYNHLVTTKKDCDKHSYDGKSIEYNIKKYNGMLEYFYEDGWFMTDVII